MNYTKHISKYINVPDQQQWQEMNKQEKNTYLNPEWVKLYGGKRNNYIHKQTGKIAEYDSIMSLWYVTGEEKNPIGFWQLNDSQDWDILVPPVDNMEPLFSINEIHKAMLAVSNHVETYIGTHQSLLNYLKKSKSA